MGHHDEADTLIWHAAFTGGTGSGRWTFPIKDGKWQAISLVYNKSDDDNDPTVRVNFVEVTETQDNPPGPNPVAMDDGYCVGNDSIQERGWDGRIAHLQVFNRILTTDEQDACLLEPGSVTNGLRLWLRLNTALDVRDRSLNGFDGTATNLVTGASGPGVFTRPPGVSAGVVFLTTGILPIKQWFIPRYADGTTHPAGQVRGYGASSVIQGTVYGPSDGTEPLHIVQTDNFDETVNYWANGDAMLLAAVQQVEVRDLTIAGKDDLGNGYGQGGAVNDQPQLNPVSTYKDRETGLAIQSGGALVENVRFFHIAGTCCRIKSPGGLGSLSNAYQPFDREKTTVRNVWCLRAYSGLEVQQVDTVVGNISCRALRDWGVKFRAASTQIDGAMHLYGVTSAPATTSGVTPTPSPAVWFDTTVADRCWGGPWYVETSDIGMKINSNANVLGPIYSHTCLYGNIQILGVYNTIRDFEITANASLASGSADGGGPSTIQLDTDSSFVSDSLNGLRVVITSGTGAGQSRAIIDYDGPSDTATVSPGWVTEPTAGSGYAIRQAPAIDIAPQENTVINGRIGPGGAVPDGVVAVRIGNGTRQVIRDLLIFGTANSSAPLITVEGNGFVALKNSVIVAHCFQAGTFLDLYPLVAREKAQGGSASTIELALVENYIDDYFNTMTISIVGGTGSGQTRTVTDYVGSTDTAHVSPNWTTNPDSTSIYEIKANRIGTGNYIWITTDGTVPTPINLPPMWDSATNEIWVDGDRKP